MKYAQLFSLIVLKIPSVLDGYSITRGSKMIRRKTTMYTLYIFQNHQFSKLNYGMRVSLFSQEELRLIVIEFFCDNILKLCSHKSAERYSLARRI